MSDSNYSRLKKQRGIASILVVVGMFLTAIALPVATKLVQQNQENRSSAAGGTTCSSFPKDIGNKTCNGSYVKTCQTTNGSTVQWVQSSSPCEYGCNGGTCKSAPTCTWSTGNWSDCTNGTQTRSVTKTPSGCTGTPANKPSESQSCTITCTGYTYSSWSACNSNGTQTRTVIGTTPSGCTGSPSSAPYLSQSCTYVPSQVCTPRETKCENNNYLVCKTDGSAWTTTSCTSNQSCSAVNGCVTKETPTTKPICTANTQYKCDGRNLMKCNSTGSAWGLTKECGIDQTCNATTKTCDSKISTPTTIPTPTTPTCTGYIYGSWSACNSNGTQTRTVIGTTPSGCTGSPSSAPYLSQSCTYVPSQVCTPRETKCENNNYLVCKTDGSAWTTTSCTSNQSCSAVNGCVTKETPTTKPICTADTQSKCDGRNLMKCNSTGTAWILNRECGIDQTCNATTMTCDSKSSTSTSTSTYNSFSTPTTPTKSCKENNGNCISVTEIASCKSNNGTILDKTTECLGSTPVCCVGKKETEITSTKIETKCSSSQDKCVDGGRTLYYCDVSSGIMKEKYCGSNGCDSVKKQCKNCNSKEDNNKDGVVNTFDAIICSSKDGVCNPDYNEKTLTQIPSDSQACLVGKISWSNKTGKDGQYSWSCQGISPDSRIAYCKAYVQKGTFGGECNKNEDCKVDGLSRCVDNKCMAPGGCVSAKIDSTPRTWKGSICINDKQYVCKNVNNSIGLLNNDFWKFDTINCPLGCNSNGINCIQNGYKCVTKTGNEIFSEYYQDNKIVESLKCDFGCDNLTGRCNSNPKSTSKNPLCDAAGGTCFGNVKTCQQEGGTIINKTDCTAPQVCCRVEEEIDKSCLNPTTQRRYSNGSSVCASSLESDDVSGSGDTAIKCQNGSLTSTFCEFGCQSGICLKGKNQTCKYNYECDSNYCGSEGVCLLKPEGSVCQSGKDCQSGNCPIGICLKPEAECSLSWKKANDWFWGCDQGQSCTQGKCVTDGVCGLANQKDGRTFTSPPTQADNLCKSGKATTVETLKDGNYSWQCTGSGYLSKSNNCSASKGNVNCGGLPENSKKCGNAVTILVCTKDGWEPKPCSEESINSEFCVSDKCVVRSEPKKEGDFCSSSHNLYCPQPLVCDSSNNTCTTKEKLNIKQSSKTACKSSKYNGVDIYDTDACNPGYSCNRRTETCELINTGSLTKYLRHGDVCTNDSQCVSGYCQPMTGDSNGLQFCNDIDQKAYVDKGNKNLAIGAAIVAAPFVVAAAPSIITSVGGWAMTNMAVMATKFPALAALIAGADSVGDVGEIIYGAYVCTQNPNLPQCQEAIVKAQMPGLWASVSDEIGDYVAGLGSVINRSVTDEFSTKGLKLAGDYGESIVSGFDRLGREAVEMAGEIGKNGVQSEKISNLAPDGMYEDITYKFKADPNLGKPGYYPGEITHIGGVPIQGPGYYDLLEKYGVKMDNDEINRYELFHSSQGRDEDAWVYYEIQAAMRSQYPSVAVLGSQEEKLWNYTTGINQNASSDVIDDYLHLRLKHVSDYNGLPYPLDPKYIDNPDLFKNDLNKALKSNNITPVIGENNIREFYDENVLRSFFDIKPELLSGNTEGWQSPYLPNNIFVVKNISEVLPHEAVHNIEQKFLKKIGGEFESESSEMDAYLYGFIAGNVTEGRNPLDFNHLDSSFSVFPRELYMLNRNSYLPSRVRNSVDYYYGGDQLGPKYLR